MFAVGGGGLFAGIEFAAFPADVFGLGFEVLHFARGQAELALKGRAFDFLALQAVTRCFDFLAQAFELGFKFGDAKACGLIGGW